MASCISRTDFPLQHVQDEGTSRALRLAQYVNVPVYIVHVMSGGAVAEIAAAKARGQRVVGEAVASGFGAEEGKIWDLDFKVLHTLRHPSLRWRLHERLSASACVRGRPKSFCMTPLMLINALVKSSS